MKTVLITGVTGTLGAALAEVYANRGWKVVGVSRQADAKQEHCARMVQNAQRTVEDARALAAEDFDVALLNAGQIEGEIADNGMPLLDQTESIYEINALFPSYFALVAAERAWERPVDVVCIGSIADGAPSCFGPVYHASKIAAHYFYTGVGPIANHANPRLRLRLYRPGAIQGPLSWAPVIRLNERGTRIRKRRCDSAPDGATVARRIAAWVDGKQWVGTYDEPISFRLLRVLFALAPNLYYRLQQVGWRKGSRFAGGVPERQRDL